jgi:hypothetical protein
MPEDHSVHDLQSELREGGRPAAFLYVTFLANRGKRPHGRRGSPTSLYHRNSGRIRSLIFLSTQDGTHSGCAFLRFHDPGSGVTCLAQSRQLKALSSFIDLRPAHGTFRDLMVGLDQMCSPVFVHFLRPSSTPPNFFKVFQASLTFGDLQ